MATQIIGLQDWLGTPAGQYLLHWEQAQLDKVVADVFGYHALQLGLPKIASLQANRMPHRWTADAIDATEVQSLNLLTDFATLPFPVASLDLLVLPHTLEFSHDPHATLREAERVLVPDGRIIVCGLNPASLWGWAQRRQRLYRRMGLGTPYLPESGDFIGYWRLRDWLRLLGFEVESGSFGCYSPAVRSQAWLDRMAWMDTLGGRYWPILGAAYCVVAVKRVHGMRLMGASWKRTAHRSNAPVSIAPRAHSTLVRHDFSQLKQDEHD